MTLNQFIAGVGEAMDCQKPAPAITNDLTYNNIPGFD